MNEYRESNNFYSALFLFERTVFNEYDMCYLSQMKCVFLCCCFCWSCGSSVTKPNENKETIGKEEIEVSTETIETPQEGSLLPLLRGKWLPNLLSGSMSGMRMGMKGNESVLHTIHDMDGDGDQDILVQVLFQRGDVVKDAFAIYYNNTKANNDTNFELGFSANHYHELGGEGGEPRPCDLCLLEENKEDLFYFKDRANGELLIYKFVQIKGLGLKWEKQ